MTDVLIPTSFINKGVGQTPGTSTIDDSSTEIVPENLPRVAIAMTNIGKNDAWIACDGPAILGEGVLMARNGGNVVLDQSILTTGPINGICDIGKETDITFHEFNQ